MYRCCSVFKFTSLQSLPDSHCESAVTGRVQDILCFYLTLAVCLVLLEALQAVHIGNQLYSLTLVFINNLKCYKISYYLHAYTRYGAHTVIIFLKVNTAYSISSIRCCGYYLLRSRFVVASFQGPHPASRRLQYCKPALPYCK